MSHIKRSWATYARLFAATLLLSSGFAGRILADGPGTRTVVQTVSAQDRLMHSDFTTRGSAEPTARVGRGFPSYTSSCMVLPVQLPVLQPGESIASATLSVNIQNWTNWFSHLDNLDLYGIWITNTSAVVNDPDYFVDGANPGAYPYASNLQDNLAVPADISAGPTGSGQTIVKVSDNIGDFFQALYDGGAQGGEYAFLTLTHDDTLSSQSYYDLSTADSTSFPKPSVEFIISPPIPVIQPGAQWNGTPGSGFSSTPVDPQRTTAKPMMRLLTPTNQFFTDRLLVGVIAGANYQGSLYDNMGLEKVVLYYEGNSVDITKPSYATFDDVNGNECTYFGWWAELEHNGQNGHAQVYFEAIPKDTSMQTRVMGPFRYSPQATLYDYQIEVAATPDEIPGQRYKTLSAAMLYLKNQSAQNPLITITEAGSYGPGATGGSNYSGAGYCNITASVPATIALPTYTSDGASLWRPKYDRLRLFGGNLTWDMQNISELYREGGGDHWIDGIKVTNSAGKAVLWRGGPRPVSWPIRGAPWMTECDMEFLNNMGSNAMLVRGCHFTEGYNDVCNGTYCVYYSTCYLHNSAELIQQLPALTVEYTGAASSATIQKSGNQFILREDGTTIGTYVVYTEELYYQSDANYFVHNVVDWINTKPGWTAILDNDERRAANVNLPTETQVKNSPQQLVTSFDPHSDFYQKGTTSPHENIVIFGNRVVATTTQDTMIGGSGLSADWLVANNAFHNASTAVEDHTALKSHTNHDCSHLVYVHNTWVNQPLFVDANVNPDAYCMFSNNSTARMQQGTYGVGVDISPFVVKDQHYHTFKASITIGSTGCTIGGDEFSLYVDAASGDFTPAGELIDPANLKPAALRFDINGNERSALDAAGAVSTNTIQLTQRISPPEVEADFVRPDGTIVLSFPTTTRFDYQIEYSADLAQWYQAALLNGTGSVETWTDSTPIPVAGFRFYRVVMAQNP